MISDDPTGAEALALYRTVTVLSTEQRLEQVKYLLESNACEVRGLEAEPKNGWRKVGFEIVVRAGFNLDAFDQALELLKLRGVTCLDRRCNTDSDGFYSITLTFYVPDESARDPQDRYERFMLRGGIHLRG